MTVPGPFEQPVNQADGAIGPIGKSDQDYCREGGTAFPFEREECPGMTLRDWFASQAASDIFYGQITAFPEDKPSSVNDAAATAAEWAYLLADAMLAARNADKG